MESKSNRVATTPERMRQAMERAKKKQIDLVHETGIDKGSISNYLSGRYEPKQEAIHSLDVALNVSEMWLWGFDVPMERPKEKKATMPFLTSLLGYTRMMHFWKLLKKSIASMRTS